jgi:transcription elongation factor GreA
MGDKGRIELTQQAYDRLQAELAYLEGEARESIVGEIASARSHGDLSENAEYHAAKDQQGLQEARIRQIKEMLEHAEIITTDEDSAIKPGKVVTIRYQGEDPETYLIGRREERSGDYPVLTPDSPAGQALVGRLPGETVVAKGPLGELEIEIVEVRSL